MEQKDTKKIKGLLLLMLILWVMCLPAQYKPGSLSNGILPAVVPSSPEASSLGKFGEWPVSQYTGVPNISIPIYTINIDGFQLPIQLSYHAGGVKLDEVSSWVGTNWTLSAGGCISRTIVGLPDERMGGFLYQNQRGLTLKSSYDLNNADDYVTMTKIIDGNLDTEPDVFFYNFGGLSGKFYFDEAGNFQTIPASNLKLIRSPINNTLTNSYDEHWEVADASGNVYHFASYLDDGKGFEKTGIVDNMYSTQFTTSWYLTKIVLANSADIIYLDYADKIESYELPLAQSFRILTNSEPLNYQYASPSQPGADPLKINQVLTNGSPSGSTSNHFGVNGKALLEKIRWRGGEIQFIANTLRLDIDQGKMLDKVSIFDKTGYKKKDFLIKYQYTQKRYFIDSLVELDPNSVNRVAHQFEYFSPAYLPVRGSTGYGSSFAQDHWGFYNGASSNPNLLPSNINIGNGVLTANREPSELYMVYGTLSKIKFPTGGYTEFEYEAHRYDPASPVNGGPSSTIAEYSINCTAANPQLAGTIRTQNFTVAFAQNSNPITIQFKNYNKPASKEAGWLPIIRIEKLINGTYQSVYSWNAYDQFPVGNVPPPNQYGLIDYTYNEFVSFSAGDYRIVTDLICGITNCGTPPVYPSVISTIKYFTYTGQLPIAGGLRIKQITNYSGPGIFASRKKYTYNPGKLLIYPKYEHQYAEFIWPFVFSAFPKTPCGTLYAKYKEITTTSQAILGFTHGATVGYVLVKEEDLTPAGDDKGYTNFRFTYTPDVLNAKQYDGTYWSGLTILNGSIPLDVYEYKRGLLESKEIYLKKPDNTYIRIYSLINTYDYNDGNIASRYNSLRAMRVKRMITMPGGGNCGYTLNGYTVPTAILPPLGSIASFNSYSFYNTLTSWVKLSSTTESNYDQQGANPTTIVTNYSYNNPAHLQVTSITTNSSRGNIIKTDLKYPHDLPTTSPYNTMIGKNIISPVIEQVQTNVSLSKELTRLKVNYQLLPGNILIKPITNEKSILGNPLEIEGTINQYDSKGNVLQITGKDGIIISYIWGYNQQYLVAKIKGKAYSNVLTQSAINLALIDNVSTSELIVRGELNKLRILTGCMVNTYTYRLLVGVISETDPNGNTTYYSYDALDRLQLVKDKDGKVLKMLCYNYAGQPGDCSVNVTPTWTATGNLRCATSGGNNTGYQEREEKDMNSNSPSYNQTQWVVTGYNASSCPLPVSCSFSIMPGYSLLTSSISSSAGVVSFYIVFSTANSMTPGNSYFVAGVNGACSPSTTRTINFSSGSQNWSITIYPNGQMIWYLLPGSAPVNAYSTIGTNTLAYNL